ncbi:specific transcription factor domain protein [Aspergillus parasiticus SU-1]|uniref:Specific transcription factor domain protein n=1 Tax=Aspergillus parasiticus (strain ATCC 56775 / NRRL 5862 / SRRC 143 / SU-1) TaxID=1403190 RepID=A0A0F0II29_ASPPU|nr:specific transcription factor domain protein [Aspergillus parasiticus SU-1]
MEPVHNVGTARDVATLCAIERRRGSLPSQARDVPTIIDESESIARDYHFPNDAYTSDSVLDQSREADRSGVGEDENEGIFDGDKFVVDGATALTALERSACGSRASSSALDTSHLHSQESSTSRGTNDGLSAGHSSIGHLLCQPNTQTPESLQPVFLEYAFSPLSDVYHYRPHGIATHEAGTYIPPFSLGLAVSRDESPLPEPFLPVTCTEKARLISSFMQETGTWCETTDSNMHFTMRSLHSMMKSTAFVAAAMSLASRQLDHVEKVQRPVTLELYQYTIQLLLRQDPTKADASVLATCTLLCVYEMMASDVHEWRRHLKGCAGLLLAKKWNGSSQGIVKSCFWAFARIDVWAAFISGKTTLIPTDFWLDDTSIESLATERDVDDYCNLAIFIFAQVVNIANWVNQLQPLYIAGAVFANKSSSLSACPDSSDDQVRFSPSSIFSIIRQNIPSHHARSNLEEEYATEKILLLKHLARIENETGWKTSDRAADLRKLWGF